MTMQLKLLGVLQDFGTPYASLYRQDNKDTLFIAIEQGRENGYFKALLLQVGCSDVRQYINGHTALSTLTRNASATFLWKRKKHERGIIAPMSKTHALSSVNDDEPFDADFCSDISLINYNLDLIGCTA